MSWNSNFLFQSSDWTSNLKLFSTGLFAKSLKSERKAWLNWAENLIVFFHSLFLNFKPPAVLWRSHCQEIEMWAQGLADMGWNFDFFFLFIVIEFQTLSCFMKVSLSRAWNLSPRLGSYELKIWLFFFILCAWTSNLKLLFWRSRCKKLEMWDQGLAQMNSYFEFFFSFNVIELKSSSYFRKVLLPRAWNLSP